ncbi:hypothetical protein RI844_02555 [Thalassotalea fonticola]|uniref:Fibronectin type-III domain-containing protein n=1 Tax=Thalassotalea fonticola TaxID=3065649 RepID=A0ABZ0GR59_9GAMM|nr:hypothetical protein RI844_02555 [Colwelliaceae bacterium S1-1]
MNTFKYSILFSALLLTACGDSSVDDEPTQENLKEVAEPVQETTTEEEFDNNDGSTEQNVEQDPETSIEVQADVKLIDSNNNIPNKLAISSDNSTVALKWFPVQGAVGYNVYYNENLEVNSASFMFEVSNPKFTHQGLDANLHSYKVQAVFADSLSDLSSPASADLSSYSPAIADTDY